MPLIDLQNIPFIGITIAFTILLSPVGADLGFPALGRNCNMLARFPGMSAAGSAWEQRSMQCICSLVPDLIFHSRSK